MKPDRRETSSRHRKVAQYTNDTGGHWQVGIPCTLVKFRAPSNTMHICEQALIHCSQTVQLPQVSEKIPPAVRNFCSSSVKPTRKTVHLCGGKPPGLPPPSPAPQPGRSGQNTMPIPSELCARLFSRHGWQPSDSTSLLWRFCPPPPPLPRYCSPFPPPPRFRWSAYQSNRARYIINYGILRCNLPGGGA